MLGRAEDRGDQEGAKKPERVEDKAEVVADGGEYGVELVFEASLEVVAAEVSVVLHVSDDRLDGGMPRSHGFHATS